MGKYKTLSQPLKLHKESSESRQRRDEVSCCLIVFFVIFMLALATFCFCQNMMDVSITAYYQTPVGTYLDLRIKRFIDDTAGPSLFFCLDPAGASTMHQIRLVAAGAAGDLVLDGTILGTNPPYNINLNNGNAFLNNLDLVNNLKANQIYMTWGLGTPGKHVYDLAEGISAGNCESCDVVIISQDKDLTVEKSKRSFDSLVAGVISENPKLYLGALPGFKPLALAGVVRCKVTVENGPIRKGDLLVTSSLPGYAMRASPGEVRPGMVLGSALENLEKGVGKIYILVNQ